MIKTTIPGLILLLLMTTGYTQNVTTDSSATCVAYWKKGDVKNIVINKSSTTLRDGKKPETSSYSFGVTVTILEESETAYTVQWQYEMGKYAESLPELDKFNQLLRTLKIVYATSETGAFDSLVNYEEVKKYIAESMNLLLSTNKNNDPVLLKFMEQIKSMLQSRVAIENVILREINLYHAPYGIEYDLKHPQILDSELPNIFGGQPFPAILTLSLLKLDATKDFARIGVKQELDKQRATELLQEAIQKLATTIDSGAKDKVKLETIAISDHMEYDLALSDGWIKKAVLKRMVQTPGIHKTEITEILIK